MVLCTFSWTDVLNEKKGFENINIQCDGSCKSLDATTKYNINLAEYLPCAKIAKLMAWKYIA